MLYYSMPALAAGFILDLMIGDPRWLYHPVCLIGNLIAFLEKILRKIFPKTDKGELAAGTVEVILVCLLSGGIPFLILHILYGISVWAGFALETFWCYQLLATKSLKTESMKVYDRQGSLPLYLQPVRPYLFSEKSFGVFFQKCDQISDQTYRMIQPSGISYHKIKYEACCKGRHTVI